MQKVGTVWGKNGDWKARYSKLYTAKHVPLNQEKPARNISFMSNDSATYSSLATKMRDIHRESTLSGLDTGSPHRLTSLMSGRSECYGSYRGSINVSDNLGGNETLLLDMVRAQSKEMEEELQAKTLELPRDTAPYIQSNEACVHGLSWRTTERSVSRSRVSRISTRRDMDIPSILAFTTDVTTPAPLEIPAFRNIKAPKPVEIPKWSIRRSVCPVCSQKWRDRSSVNNVKSSGLKRNSSIELPTISAPARLKTAITMAYAPRPAVAAADDEIGAGHSALRNTSAAWQLTRARRFRMPKPQMPSPEARAPPSVAAPCARKDLDLRVCRFLSDEFI